jgi:hypothetical protein
MRSRRVFLFFVLFTILTLIAACGKATPTIIKTSTPAEKPAAIATQPAPQTAIPSAAATDAPTAAPLEDANALPPEPQLITFTSSDGTALQGYYYPSAHNPSPLVVFMHWMMGNQSDWNELAVWLQNRGQINPFPNPGDPAKFHWWDPSWFPEVPVDRSYAVFVFTFRTCLPFDQGGCPTINEAGWLKDAQAAILKARELEGVDPQRIVAIGSSIGADGVPDGCKFLNDQFPGSCLGALSLSPGGYLTIPYTTIVSEMGKATPPTAAWCLADEKEFEICSTAEGAGNAAYKDFKIQGGGHGNMLLSPDLDPLPMQLILEFLDETLK